jgi:hypothetical protein
MAFLYSMGFGVQLDAARAVELYLLVGAKEIREAYVSAIAYNNLAALLMAGAPGLPPDPDRAREYGRRSEDLGFPTPWIGR